MERIIKIIEIILVSLFIIATGMRLMDMTEGETLTMLSLLGLGLFYLGVGYSNKLRKEKMEILSEQQNTIFARANLVVGIIGSISCIGILFKIMFWPGSEMFLLTGAITFALFLLFFIKIKITTKNPPSFYTKMIFRAVLFFLVTFSLYIISTDSLVDIFYKKQPQYGKMVKESIANPTDSTIRLRMEEYRKDSK